ncbi:hypothetical protein H6F44_11165 [Pseudanabaena sp. FACHB-1277]|uniref:Uncharacterized protein n=1 Tax=Pseudanabaena cinerea FACHB-1277 TaxID=2949581 RepID=A0A926UT99_9CYAN|nr:hypothetical protein [Pseudanabaena cinerea]MBD2150674.1 hypothetical protein [Pseudanabaena cinerea FACHB-1277]
MTILRAVLEMAGGFNNFFALVGICTDLGDGAIELKFSIAGAGFPL